MWRYAAERYRTNPIVVGYDLMCEPNSNAVLYDNYDPEDFYAQHRGSLADWNQFFPRMVAAIREVDPDTPILVSAMSWGAVPWLPYVEPIADTRTVYTVHQYAPQEQYTHQPAGGPNTYPGLFDTDYDGAPDTFDATWLANALSPVADFRLVHGAPVAVNEFGIQRWEPGAAQFMGDEMDVLEQLGANYALWAWDPASFPHPYDQDEFDFRFGPDPGNHAPAVPNALHTAITDHWRRNAVRP